MIRTPASRPAGYFEALYAASPDPWNFAGSDYEHAKYRATLAALPQPRFGAAFEVGCSIGVLTARLAPRCDRLLAVDAAEAPLARARAATAGFPHVRIARMCIPDQWPEERFDLIVFSEVLYFLSPTDVARTASATLAALAPDGCVVLVNWTGHSDDPCGGEQAVRIFEATACTLRPLTRSRTQHYRLDVLSAARPE
jgi:predicted TPR repeat methyltransferase